MNSRDEESVRLDSRVVGAAGEHLVLSRLLSRGILAAKVPEGTAMVDLVVHQVAPDGSLAFAVAIQVKTRTRGADGGWHMKPKHETQREPWLFYAFVDFQPEHPNVYVIPSAKVAQLVHDEHAIWLAMPGKKGQAHNENTIRRIRPKWPFDVPGGHDGWMDVYKEAWDILGVEPAAELEVGQAVSDE